MGDEPHDEKQKLCLERADQMDVQETPAATLPEQPSRRSHDMVAVALPVTVNPKETPAAPQPEQPSRRSHDMVAVALPVTVNPQEARAAPQPKRPSRRSHDMVAVALPITVNPKEAPAAPQPKRPSRRSHGMVAVAPPAAAKAPLRRFQIRLGPEWKDMSPDEQKQIREGIAKGETEIFVRSRGTVAKIDLKHMTQTSLEGRVRNIREVDEAGNELVPADLDLGGSLEKLGPGELPEIPAELPMLGGSWSWIRKQNGVQERKLRLNSGNLVITAFKRGGYKMMYNGTAQEVKFQNIHSMLAETRVVTITNLPRLLDDPQHTLDLHYGGISTEKAAEFTREGFKTVTVNAASAYHAGGGFTTGGRHALEEALCSQTTLYPALHKIASNGQRPHIPADGVILSPGVEYFRRGSDLGYPPQREPLPMQAVVSVAMYNKNRNVTDAPMDAPKDEAAYTDGIRRKFTVVMHTAAFSGAEAIIIPDIGCGVFGNDPTLVGQLAGDALRAYCGYFKRILFTGNKKFNDAACLSLMWSPVALSLSNASGMAAEPSGSMPVLSTASKYRASVHYKLDVESPAPVRIGTSTVSNGNGMLAVPRTSTLRPSANSNTDNSLTVPDVILPSASKYRPSVQQPSVTVQAYTFKPGKMGIDYDEEGIVKKVEKRAPADVMGIRPGAKIVKFALDGAAEQTYSRVALANAETCTSGYTVVLLVNVPSPKETANTKDSNPSQARVGQGEQNHAKHPNKCVVCEQLLKGDLALLINERGKRAEGLWFLHKTCIQNIGAKWPKHDAVALPRPGEDPISFLKALDIDGNNYLSKEEVRAIVLALSVRKRPEKDFEAKWALWDKDQDGCFSLENIPEEAAEFIAWTQEEHWDMKGGKTGDVHEIQVRKKGKCCVLQ